MNVVDSSGWLEYFADETNADFFAQAIQSTEKLIVPTITVFEVFKRVFQQRGEGDALQAIAMMAQGKSVELNFEMAVSAAKLSTELKLPIADSIILATAHASGATLWTQDIDFEEIPGVKYVSKTHGKAESKREG